MIQFLAGLFLGALVAVESDKFQLGSQAQIEINKCEEELPRNEKCVLYAKVEGE